MEDPRLSTTIHRPLVIHPHHNPHASVDFMRNTFAIRHPRRKHGRTSNEFKAVRRNFFAGRAEILPSKAD